MDKNLESFKQFMKQRENAARAYVSGDPAPVADLSTHISPATFFGPRGGYVQGAEEVLSKFTQDATNFATGSDTHFEILDMAASETIAYWVGLQPSMVRLVNVPNPVPMNLRITEIFRREAGEWKLVHRHADMLAVPT